jgi:hypothetical protein
MEELDLPIQIAASNNIGEPSLVRGLVVYRVVHFFLIPYYDVGYNHRRSSAKWGTRCSKRYAVSGGEHSTACVVAFCPYDCRSSTAYTDQNRPHPPTCNAKPITSGW